MPQLVLKLNQRLLESLLLLLHDVQDLKAFYFSLLFYIAVKVHETPTNPDHKTVILQDKLLLQSANHVSICVEF